MDPEIKAAFASLAKLFEDTEAKTRSEMRASYASLAKLDRRHQPKPAGGNG